MLKQCLAGLFGMLLSLTTLACDLDGGLGLSFNVGREGALTMAVAMAEARQNGLIGTAEEIDAQALTKLRARLWQLKLKAYQGEKPTFYFYQALDQHWSQVSEFAGSTQVSLHRPPRLEMEEGVVVMSHGDVLDALMSGQLELSQAETKHLITLTGPEDQVEQVKRWIREALSTSSAPLSIAAGYSPR